MKKEKKKQLMNESSMTHRATAELKVFERLSNSAEEASQLARFTMDNVVDAVYWMDSKARIVDLNETACGMLGYTREELLNFTVFDIDPDFTMDKWVNIWEKLKGQVKLTIETKHRRKDGRIIPVEIMANYLSFGGRELDCAFARDISERKRQEQALVESEAKYRSLFDSSTDGIFILDLDGNFIDANKTAYERLGYSREEFLSLNIRKLDHPSFIPRVPERFKQIREHGVAVFESGHLRKDGSIMPVEVNSRLLEYKEKQVYFSVIRDITDRKRTEEALQASEERFRGLVESTSDWVWEVDQKGVYTYVSPQIRNLLGYAPEEVIGKTPLDLMPSDEAQRIAEIFKSSAANKGPIRNLENFNRHKDGRLVVLETSGVPFYDSHGDFRGYRGIDRDITERKLVAERLEASLREKETLLRELYHRTKNNMQVISNLIDLQTLDVNDEKTLKLFKETQNRIKTMALVHEKLYQSKDLSNLNLKYYIGDLANALLGSYQLSGDRINLKLDVEPISVSIDTATPCGLIINELMSNSLKHAFPGDRRGEISIVLHQSEKGEIDMRFSDNGIGLPKGFDFKNTRSLGLTLVRNLSVKQLEGTIEVTTEHPTEFHIKFREPLYTQRV
jgi:PAS domain S-box-containing protein